MAVPLIAAGVKVAGKALIKKLGTKLAQKGAQKVAQKGAQKLAQEGAKKITTSAVKKGTSSGITNQFQKAKNLYNKVENIKDIKDQFGQDKTTPNNQINSKNKNEIEQTTDSATNIDRPKSNDKLVFNMAMACAVIKDAVEIVLTMYLLPWLIPILSFFPTIILTTILFLSGKKGLMKIVVYFVAIFIDYFFPGINALPITTIATFITFKVTPATKIDVKNKDVSKGLNIIKSFIK